MQYLPLSFLAGVLTILAPCVLPVLPIIIGGSITDRRWYRPLVITLSLAASIVVFTLSLKATTFFIDIPSWFWKYFSGGIVLAFALSLLMPNLWAKLSSKLSLGTSSHGLLSGAQKKDGLFGMILMGAALGPVFASCSPTYFFILGTVLPANFFVGLLNLIVYALGLALVMLVIAVLGQRATRSLRSAADPNGWFKKTLGVLFLIVAFGILTGYDKKFEAWVIDKGWIDTSGFESQLLER